VLRAITQFGAIFSEPGVVDLKVAGYTLIEAGQHSQAVADLMTSCGLDGRVSSAINTEIWRKLIFNCVINPITSIVGSEVGGIADPRLDPLSAFSACVSCMSGVGPALSPPGVDCNVGPYGGYGDLTAPAKLMLSFFMILGRLEVFTLIALLSPSFWRRS